MKALNRFLATAASRRDLVFVALLVTTLCVMIVPMPPSALDVLIAVNMALTALILLISVYLDRATSFSTFPTVILLATTFRLAISISTTRSVLSLGDAGEIVNTFGRFVTAGNIAIGLVIFLIISIVQFVVVTKGAERIAEVAARFILDALPGRQMSIDAELRAGEITSDEAKRRRQNIDKENQFFGAMDGAMKFVKGDAITGLLIVAVNLIGGLSVGLFQNHMSLGEAVQTYSLLTIGDGLVAQIPALLIAMSAGIINTRVTHAESAGDLGSDVIGELLRSPRAIGAAGVVVCALGLVPGFPILAFAVLGLSLMGLAYMLNRRRQTELETADTGRSALEAMAANAQDRLVIRTGAALYASLSPEAFVAARDKGAAEFETRLGFSAPAFGLASDASLADDEVVLDFEAVPIANARLNPGELIALAESRMLQLAGVASFTACAWLQYNADHAFIVPGDSRPLMEKADIKFWTGEQALARFAFGALRRAAPSLIGFDTVQAMLTSMRAENPDLADHVTAVTPVARIVDILRRLVAESVPIKPVRVVFEAVGEWSPRFPDPEVVVEHVRRRLGAQICHTLSDETRNLPCYVVAPDFEQALRGCLRQVQNGVVFHPTAAVAERLVSQVRQMRRPLDPSAPQASLLTAPDLRRHLRALLQDYGLRPVVLSQAEIGAEFRPYPVGALTLVDANPAKAA